MLCLLAALRVTGRCLSYSRINSPFTTAVTNCAAAVPAYTAAVFQFASMVSLRVRVESQFAGMVSLRALAVSKFAGMVSLRVRVVSKCAGMVPCSLVLYLSALGLFRSAIGRVQLMIVRAINSFQFLFILTWHSLSNRP